MKINYAILIVSFTGLIACSENDHSFSSSVGDLSKEECSKLGGRIVEDMGCIQDIPEGEMKRMCENNGMTYSSEFDGCIE